MARRLGQHFLFDPSILERIVDALDPEPGDPVLEIGPGRGTLTRHLLARGLDVTAIEYDRSLLSVLAAEVPAARVVEGDALKVNWESEIGATRFKVVGNVPYNITTPLIDRALSAPASVTVFLIQSEVADRLAATPGSKVYGALSVGVQLAADTERLFTVKPGAFRPPPKVSSAVVRIRPRSDAPPEVRDPGFRRFVTDLFGQRRKQLVRALRTTLNRSAESATSLLEQCGVAPSARIETVPPGTILSLYRATRD